MSLWCHEVCGVGVREGAVLLVPLSAVFQSLLRLPTIKLGLSGVDSRVDGFVYVLGLCVSLQRTLLWGWEFLPLWPQPPQVFSVRDFWGFISPALEPWVVLSLVTATWSLNMVLLQTFINYVCYILLKNNTLASFFCFKNETIKILFIYINLKCYIIKIYDLIDLQKIRHWQNIYIKN